MHSANRAKQRLMRTKIDTSKHWENDSGGGGERGERGGSRNAKSARPHVDLGTRRSKSLDRKTTLRKVKDIRAYSPKGKTYFPMANLGDQNTSSDHFSNLRKICENEV